jgi:hypothetical protein
MMQYEFRAVLMVVSLALLLAGCSAPSPIGLHVMDALSGDPLANVEVRHWDKHGDKPGGITNSSGRLEGIPVKIGDRLGLSLVGYQPVVVEISFADARLLQPIPRSENDKAPHGVIVPIADADPLPYAADHSLTVLLRPARPK